MPFSGIGDPTRVSSGSLLRDALNFRSLFYTDAWAWWLVPPIAAISLLVLGVTFLAMALEPLINPRLARHFGGGTPRMSRQLSIASLSGTYRAIRRYG